MKMISHYNKIDIISLLLLLFFLFSNSNDLENKQD